jgi:hypothetical protein
VLGLTVCDPTSGCAAPDVRFGDAGILYNGPFTPVPDPNGHGHPRNQNITVTIPDLSGKKVSLNLAHVKMVAVSSFNINMLPY